MIISHKNKFVFVKTTKTAGTSVEIALSGSCGDEDILSKLHPTDEAIRLERSGRGSQNVAVTKADKVFRFDPHTRGKRARAYLGRAEFAKYFSFAFERNPFDRVVSAYFYIKKMREQRGEDTSEFTFDAMVGKQSHLKQLHDRGWGLYTDQDEIFVTKVYKFEELQTAMADIVKQIGLPETVELPHTKTSSRSRDYRDYYSSESRAAVEEVFAQELATFGYSF